MKKLKIAVGTQSEKKIGFLQKVLDEMGVEAELIPHPAKSGVPEQPATEELVVKGSLNRANEALSAAKDCDFAIGIEFGYQLVNKKYDMFTYSTIVDSKGYKASSKSSSMPLPNFFQKLLKEDKYLGEYTQEYESGDKHPSAKYLARIVRFREPFIVESVRNALLIYLHKEEFK